MSVEAAPAAPVRGGDWFGQPRGLTILFLTETWETFSFFGMRALLVYYMTKQLMIAQGQASLIYGLYAAGVYFTPIVGGAVADVGSWHETPLRKCKGPERLSLDRPTR